MFTCKLTKTSSLKNKKLSEGVALQKHKGRGGHY